MKRIKIFMNNNINRAIEGSKQNTLVISSKVNLKYKNMNVQLFSETFRNSFNQKSVLPLDFSHANIKHTAKMMRRIWKKAIIKVKCLRTII